jgi:quinol-cytochrome oxidoreductase complex cytochrome b subunit
MSETMDNATGKKAVKWWPHYVLTLSVVFIAVLAVTVILATKFPVPAEAPAIIPMPDDGENVPGPEWLFLMFWQPFWTFTGSLRKFLFLMPLMPILTGALLVLLPFAYKIPFRKIPGLKGSMAKASSMRSGFVKSLFYGLPAIFFGIIVAGYAIKSGHQAKILGCDACHNPAMGFRQAIPPVNVFKYYSVERASQIGSAKYTAGKTEGVDEHGESIMNTKSDEGGYKDANWQMRHMYEPTFTW